jgi:hypothetical protein
MASGIEGAGSGTPARMPACLRTFAMPRRVIARLRAVSVPPPPSSVVTKVLPRSSAAVSYIPAASISRMLSE